MTSHHGMKSCFIAWKSCFIVIIIAVLPLCHAQIRVNTHGASGELCGETHCLRGVPCKNGKCVCPDHRGHGSFVCPETNNDLCFFNNDPMLHTIEGYRVEVPLMNKVLMTHVATKHCPRPVVARGPRTECDVRVFAWGARRLGKLFIKGLEVKVFLSKGWLIYNHAVRITASMNQNFEHEYLEEGNHNFLGNPPYGKPVTTQVAHGSMIETEYDRRDNFAIVKVKDCGLIAAIRGVDFTGKINYHSQEPGVYVQVDRECDPDYLSSDKAMCSSPKNTLQDQLDFMNKKFHKNITLHTLMVMKALNSDAFQDHPDAPTILWSLAETASECDAGSLVDAVVNCTFIFSNAPFHKCYDTELDDVKSLVLYNNCLFSICDHNKAMCHVVQQTIKASHCRNTHPERGTIMQHSCEFDGKEDN